MKRINKTDTRSHATAYGWTALLMAIPFVGIGTFFALAGFGVMAMPDGANAPEWIIGCVGLSFAFAGLMLLFSAVRGLLNRRRMREVAEDPAARPWEVDYRWNQREVRDRAGARVFASFVFLVFLCVFLTPFNWWAFQSDQMDAFGGVILKGIVSLFDLMLLFVAGSLFYRVAQYVRYFRSGLRLRRFPYHPGETLNVAFAGRPLDQLRATLRYVEERFETRGSGRNRSTSLVSYEHYSEQQVIDVTARVPEVEIAFEIPDKQGWVTQLSGTPVRYWELLIESEQPGVDFRTTFPLPIYGLR